MDTTNTNVMVALIPNDDSWCKIDFPHVTLVCVGKTEDLKPGLFNELAKTVSSLSMLTSPFYLKVSGVEVFGDDEKVDVLRLIPNPELVAMREFLKGWDNGDFPDYKPHATIGPEGSVTNWNSQSTPMPIALYFDRIVVCWGDDRLTFWLRRS